MKILLQCPSCRKFTLKQTCVCGEKTLSPAPPKYSPDDKYASYRRKAKEEQYRAKGLI